MNYIVLDREEEKIETDFDGGKYKSIVGAKKAIGKYQKYAQVTMEKTWNINIRLSEKNLLKIKAKAAEQGLPYQTFVSSILHRYLLK
jgi:predicted DNA binding CopG/RHH family protein